MVLQREPDKSLISKLKELHSLIYDTDCFGVNDLALYARYEKELIRRGYEISLSSKLEIKK